MARRIGRSRRRTSRLTLLLLALLACGDASSVHAQSSTSIPTPALQDSAPSPAGDLTRERTLLDAARTARESGDHETSRARVREAVASLLERPEEEQDETWLALLDAAGYAANDAQDLLTMSTVFQRVCEVRSRTLPDDDPLLQTTRGNLAVALLMLGDLAGARPLQEKVLEVRLRTLPDDHPDLQMARAGLAASLSALGDLAGARVLQEKVLEVCSRTLPDDHPDLQLARASLAATLGMLGDMEAARVLEEKVLEVSTLPDDHPHLQRMRANLASTLYSLGDLAGARALQERVLEAYSRTLPDDHPDVQVVRGQLATTISTLGDLAGARALQELVLEVSSRTLPADHRDLQAARGDLAATLHRLGDLAGARVLQEQVLEVCSRTLPDDHRSLQSARGHLAATMYRLGDLAGARALQEKVLEVCSRTLPDDHPDLQTARGNLAVTLLDHGDLAGARALQEKVLEVCSRTLPDDHPDLQKARGNLAETLSEYGDLTAARALEEEVLDVYSRTLPDDHPDLQVSRLNLAGTLANMRGDLAGALALQRKALEVYSRTLPDDHPDLQLARGHLAWTLAYQLAKTSGAQGIGSEQSADSRECVELIGTVCRVRSRSARRVLLESSAREAAERCEQLADVLGVALSFAGGLGVFPPSRALERDAFVLSETTRGAAFESAALSRLAAAEPRWPALRDELRTCNEDLARLARSGTTSEAFREALERREAVERQLIALAHEPSSGTAPALDFDVDALVRRLAPHDAVVAYRRCTRTRLDARAHSVAVIGLSAFVLRDSGELRVVDLGPIEPIAVAVHAWRGSLGVGGDERGGALRPTPAASTPARGAELRALVLDPLLPALDGAEHVIVVLDDELHLVPLESLPLPGEGVLVGDRYRIETRCTLTELLAPGAPTSGDEILLSLGGAAFDAEPLGASAEDPAAPAAAPAATRPPQVPAILRGGAWGDGFASLTYTGREAREIAALHDAVAEARSMVLDGCRASRESLVELAPQARSLHVATHGWFAPESIQSWQDTEPLDKFTGLALRSTGEQQVRGMSPMLLCGLALAGANLPEDAVGRAPGLITAEEMAALDLSGCELAVLSACDTSVGEHRAGQGVASLQRALQMAGARSVITSLWKVPDEATMELMLDFYRRLWVERKPKWQALWEAKQKLRDARDEAGQHRYSTRDWAAWVLTGTP